MISIVIPVYNAAEYLPDMLDSVVMQSYTEIEIILVNDGSSDNSSAICHEYADRYSYITVYDRANQGASASRNFGTEKATGEFIWFMDSDDILEMDALLTAVKAQKAYDADVVIGGMKFCFTNENRVVPKAIREKIVFGENEFKHHYKELFSLNYISSLCNKLIRRSVLIDNEIKMNESLHMYEDYVFCMDTLLKCKTVACLPEVFYNYKLRSSQSLSHRYKENIMEMFGVLEGKISEYIKSFSNEVAPADASLNNLLIYIAYKCVKNEALHKNSYTKVRSILCNEGFHSAMLNYKGCGRRYRTIQMMMKHRMACLLLMYFAINKRL